MWWKVSGGEPSTGQTEKDHPTKLLGGSSSSNRETQLNPGDERPSSIQGTRDPAQSRGDVHFNDSDLKEALKCSQRSRLAKGIPLGIILSNDTLVKQNSSRVIILYKPGFFWLCSEQELLTSTQQVFMEHYVCKAL